MKLINDDKINEALDTAYRHATFEETIAVENARSYVEDAMSDAIEVGQINCRCGCLKAYHDIEDRKCWVCNDYCVYTPVVRIKSKLPECPACHGSGKGSDVCVSCHGSGVKL